MRIGDTSGLPHGARRARWLLLFLPLLAIASCARNDPPQPTRSISRPSVDPKLGTTPSPRLYADNRPIPRGGGTYKVGVPYKIAGRWYTPRVDPSYDRDGMASWYGDDFHGRKTANGEIYDMNALSAAHPTLPMPTLVWVTSLASGRTVLVRVNDRGPYAHDRIIDLSRATARALGIERAGVARVRVRYAGPAPLDGDDRREQAHLRSQPWWRGDAGPVARAPLQRTVERRPLPDPARAGPPISRPTVAGVPVASGAPARPPGNAGRPGQHVVAGLFRSEENARRRAGEVGRFAPVRIVPTASAGGVLYAVRTESMDGADALRLRERLASAGILDVRVASDLTN